MANLVAGKKGKQELSLASRKAIYFNLKAREKDGRLPTGSFKELEAPFGVKWRAIKHAWVSVSRNVDTRQNRISETASELT